MVFSNIFFLFVFLPFSLLVGALLPKRLKIVSLLLFSLLFYFWGENYLLWILLVSTCIDYFAGLLISGALFSREKFPRKLKIGDTRTRLQKLALCLSICSNLGFLVYFKYFNFFVDNFNATVFSLGLDKWVVSGFEYIALPLGISFYTFQSMSYTIDVYSGKVRATRNFLCFAGYVTMFPQLVAGPIVRYRDVERQINNPRMSVANFAYGIRRFIYGLAKKVIIANGVAPLADMMFDLPGSELSFFTSWIGVIAYAIQIYFDFSGYSDMAIGLGAMFGIRFLENFNYPYIARSVQDFWHRWHISLSTWFRDYLYIPLGGSRGGVLKTYRNLLVVFLLCGFWHGAEWTFVVWGVYHGAFLIIERLPLFHRLHERIPRALQHIYTLVIVCFGWVLFRADKLSFACSYMRAMLGLNGHSNADCLVRQFLTMDVLMALVFGLVCVAPFKGKVAWFRSKIVSPTRRGDLCVHAFEYCYLFALFVISSILLSSGAQNPFLYFRF